MTNPRRKPSALLIFAILTGAFFLALGLLVSRRVTPAPAGPRVAATVFPLYDIVRNVAGDAVSTVLVLPPNAEPHSFEPRPSTIAAVRGSRVIYAIGHGLDDWTEPVAAASETPVLIVDRGIRLRPSVRPFADQTSGGEATGPIDPHYWLTAPNAEQIATTVAADLAARFPEHAAEFRANLADYRTRLHVLDNDIRLKLSGLRNRNIITFHGAWYYFAEAYGLKLVGTFEPSAGREPTPKYLADLEAAVRTAGVRTIYVEPQFSADTIRSFTEDRRLRLVSLDDLGGGAGRDSLINLLDYDAQTIATNQ